VGGVLPKGVLSKGKPQKLEGVLSRGVLVGGSTTKGSTLRRQIPQKLEGVLTRGALPRLVLPSVFEGFTCGEYSLGECSSREYYPQSLKDLPVASTPLASALPASTTLNFRRITLDEYSLEYSRFLAQSPHLPQQQYPSNPFLILRLLFILFTFYVSHIYTPSLISLYSYKRGSGPRCRYCLPKNRISHRLVALRKFFPSGERTSST